MLGTDGTILLAAGLGQKCGTECLFRCVSLTLRRSMELPKIPEVEQAVVPVKWGGSGSTSFSMNSRWYSGPGPSVP